MKLILLTILIFFTPLLTVYSSSTNDFDYKSINGISLGGGGYMEVMRGGGFFEFSFKLYNKDAFDIRNSIKIGGGASLYEEFFFTVYERVTLGFTKPLTSNFAIRRYILLEYAFSFFKNDVKKDFFASPYTMDIKIGSGSDFIIGKSAYFVEMSLGYTFVTKGTVRSVLNMRAIHGTISMGGRKYF